MGGHAPSASDWANASKEIPGYQVVTVPQPGDVASNGAHVGIVTGAGKTVSVTSREDRPEEYGHVVENNWGFRKENEGTMIFRRYNGPALRRMQ